MPYANPGWPTRLPIALLLAAIAYFAVTALTLQWTRSDLDPIAMPLSAYLRGPGGGWLRAAYYLMATALAGLAWASYGATSPPLRSGLASALFAIAAMALPLVAITVLYQGTPREALAALIHSLAAQTTFLCLAMGMLLLSSRWQRDPLMREGGFGGLLLAWLAFVQMWSLALARGLPQGLMQKLLIVLILLWLGWAARQLGRQLRRP
ncbi:DUF998 domain-containing protein [Dyella solisilvae]|uniref:DUF998 domain-containing protein n=1 Tax=Dyella solisilvae TaxID=1920168 RepID=A0A370K6K5_9GAMM|nr:DUF998 domain-containing protein [Dyella solisilvae]RDI98263.1 DUF998 domain-containing protein [Dyella solisilvae]